MTASVFQSLVKMKWYRGDQRVRPLSSNTRDSEQEDPSMGAVLKACIRHGFDGLLEHTNRCVVKHGDDVLGKGRGWSVLQQMIYIYSGRNR